MKKAFISLIAATVLTATHVMALVVTVDRVTGYYEGSGGEYNVTPVTGVGYSSLDQYNNNFGQLGYGTFCVDRDLSITVPGQYTAVIDPGAVTQNGNHISVGTAWLFQQFAQGTLSDYHYTQLGDPGRASDALNLQLAIWTLEGYYGYPDPSVNPFLNLAISQFGSLSGAEVDANRAYDVGVLNLYNTQTGAAIQPMLTLLPDGGSALILLGMGLSGIAVCARKFRR
jgi:hypothetical protein